MENIIQIFQQYFIQSKALENLAYTSPWDLSSSFIG